MAARTQRIASAKLREIFNEGRFWESAQSGSSSAFCADLIPHPDGPQPYCTESQMVAYYNRSGRRVALVHQYLRPDGTLGGSGRPDPKAVVRRGTVFIA